MAFNNEAIDGVTTRRINVSLDEETITRAREIGNGKVSPGLREAVRAFFGEQPKMKSVSKPAEPRWKQTMDHLGLYFNGRDWFRDGAKLSMTTVRRLKTEHPELENAEPC